MNAILRSLWEFSITFALATLIEGFVIPAVITEL